MKNLYLFFLMSFLALSSCQRKPPEFKSNDPQPDAVEESRPMPTNVNDLGWLVDNSPLVFVGNLKGQEVEKNDRGLIITHNDFRVAQVIVGESGQETVTLTTLGGTLDGQTMRVSHMPIFRKEIRYVIFCDPDKPTYDPVTGNQQGVFIVASENDGIYGYNGVSVINVEDSILQFGDITLEKQLADSLSLRTTPFEEDPDLEGDIVSVERKKLDRTPAISLERFTEIIKRLRRQ